jgi:hypothetical protein
MNSNFRVKLILTIVVILHIIFLSVLRFFPYPELFVYSYLTQIGLTPYQQIIDQHFPGLMFFPINLASLGIDTISEYRYLQLGIIGLSHIILFLLSKKLIKKDKYVLLPNLMYALWQPFFEGYVLWIDSFVVPIFLGGIYALISLRDKDFRTYLISGLLLGLGIVFKQVTAPLLIAVFLFIFSKQRLSKNLFVFFISAIIPGLLMVCYIVSKGIWSEFWYWTVTFNLTIFSDLGRKYASVGDIARSLPVFGVAIVSFVFLLRKQKNEKNDNVVLIGLTFFSLLIFAYARYDFVHLQPALPYALLLIVIAMQYISKRTMISIGVCIGFLYLYFALPLYQSLLFKPPFFFGDDEIKVSAIVQKYTDPGDSIYAFGTTPHIYYLTQTRPSGDVFVFPFDWFMRVAEPTILEGLHKDPPRVVIRDETAIVSDRRLVDYMQNIEDYVNLGYTVVDTVGSIDILIPNPNENSN